jgi:uncharacterized RDD family membrane protein YckC
MLLDWIITLIVIFGAVLLAATMSNDNFSRALGVAVVIALLLYEPVLVSCTGGTLGHYFTNLRVVDARDGGDIGFAKACARVAIKGLLGLYSFVILAATRRNQAVHDLLTRSTVQIRDPAKALPGQYITERGAGRCEHAVGVATRRGDFRLSAADIRCRRRHYARFAVACLYRQQFLLGRRAHCRLSGRRHIAGADGADDCAGLEGQAVRRAQALPD